MSFEDKTIVCIDCGAEFRFTAAEQKDFADHGFSSDPKRCKPCREVRKAAKGRGNRAPSGNSIALLNLLMLHRVTGQPAYENSARKLIEAFEARLRRAGFVGVVTEPMDGWQRGILHSFIARAPAG